MATASYVSTFRIGSRVFAASLILFTIGVWGCDRPSNGGEDAAAGPITFQPSDVQVVGTTDAIATVMDLEVLPDGRVVALNSLEPLFVEFGAEGGPPRTHGVLAGGPEEFQSPSAFVPGGLDGEPWVLDVRRHSLIRVSSEDEWAEIPIPQEDVPPGSLFPGMNVFSVSPPIRMAAVGDEILLPRTDLSGAGGVVAIRMASLVADLVALAPETGEVRTVVSLREVLGDVSADFEATDGGFMLWYRLWAACGENRIAVHDRARNQVRMFAPDGAELEPAALPAPRFTSVTPTEFATAFFEIRELEMAGALGDQLSPEDSARVFNQMVREVSGSPEQLAAYLPRYVDLRCDEDGVIWLHPLDLEVGGIYGDTLWLRVAPDGAVREVHLPERFDAFRFTSDRVWGVQRDESDVATVAWIGLGGLR